MLQQILDTEEQSHGFPVILFPCVLYSPLSVFICLWVTLCFTSSVCFLVWLQNQCPAHINLICDCMLSDLHHWTVVLSYILHSILTFYYFVFSFDLVGLFVCLSCAFFTCFLVSVFTFCSCFLGLWFISLFYSKFWTTSVPLCNLQTQTAVSG